MILFTCSYFRSGDMASVEASLKDEAAANPARIPYCLHIDPAAPGYFVLSWYLAASSRKLRTQYVHVTPEVKTAVLDTMLLRMGWITFGLISA